MAHSCDAWPSAIASLPPQSSGICLAAVRERGCRAVVRDGALIRRMAVCRRGGAAAGRRPLLGSRAGAWLPRWLPRWRSGAIDAMHGHLPSRRYRPKAAASVWQPGASVDVAPSLEMARWYDAWPSAIASPPPQSSSICLATVRERGCRAVSRDGALRWRMAICHRVATAPKSQHMFGRCAWARLPRRFSRWGIWLTHGHLPSRRCRLRAAASVGPPRVSVAAAQCLEMAYSGDAWPSAIASLPPQSSSIGVGRGAEAAEPERQL